jgi:arginine-tRNA-protein transferase
MLTNDAYIIYRWPKTLTSKELDNLLASGWFRSSSAMFKAKGLLLDDELCTVLNIRFETVHFQKSKRLRRIEKANNAFRIEIGKLALCDAMEQLYESGKSRFKGYVYPNISSFLHDRNASSPFKSQHIKVYDGDRLIAASIFDLAVNSLMSVMGLYDESYKKFSPGIFTMLCEIEYAKSLNKEYYYPGFIFEEIDIFDYKLSLGECEYFCENGEWVKDRQYCLQHSMNQKIRAKNRDLDNFINFYFSHFQKVNYPYYGLAYLSHKQDNYYYHIPQSYICKRWSDNERLTLLSYNHLNDSFSLDIVRLIEEETVVYFPKADNMIGGLLIHEENIGEANQIKDLPLVKFSP